MSRAHLNIGLFGFGTVAQGFVAALEQAKGISANISKIVVRDGGKARSLPAELFTTDRNIVLRDPHINVIVELTDDADAAFEIVKAALENEKAVITANKRLIAEHFAELVALQRKHGLPILYEAAACGSIPIIRNLEEYYDNDLLKGLEGIFNGSSNFVLSKVFRDGLSFQDALELAFDEGFLESDPRLDLEGIDAAYKLSILIAHAFGVIVAPEDIPAFGISNLGNPELRFARENGWKLKLVARAAADGDRIRAVVAPQFVAPSHRLYSVEEEYNAVVLEGAFLEGQMLLGKGAGSHPTGSAVLSDLSAISYGYGYEYRELGAEFSEFGESGIGVNSAKEGNSGDAGKLGSALNLGFEVRVYFRYADVGVLSEIQFIEIEESFRSREYAYLTGRVRLSELLRLQRAGKWKDVFFALLPEEKNSVRVSVRAEAEGVVLV
ncbi:MAG: homoserine dehydrogenase [Bacteroidetes bacterium]|nr:homoserine dehydrogenase [Bacteroidota bacterium]